MVIKQLMRTTSIGNQLIGGKCNQFLNPLNKQSHLSFQYPKIFHLSLQISLLGIVGIQRIYLCSPVVKFHTLCTQLKSSEKFRFCCRMSYIIHYFLPKFGKCRTLQKHVLREALTLLHLQPSAFLTYLLCTNVMELHSRNLRPIDILAIEFKTLPSFRHFLFIS